MLAQSIVRWPLLLQFLQVALGVNSIGGASCGLCNAALTYGVAGAMVGKLVTEVGFGTTTAVDDSGILIT